MVLNLVPLIPEIFLSIMAMGLLIVGVSCGNSSTRTISWFCAFAAFTSAMLVSKLDPAPVLALNGMFQFDAFAALMKVLILMGVIASIAVSVRYLIRNDMERFEYPVLILLSAIGMMIMVSAHNLLTLYMGLELQSLALYVLAAMRRNSVKSAEAGVKYFILGALSSGLLLFGISLIYGFTGSIDFGVISASLGALEVVPLGVTFGIVLILTAVAFKISAVPFHMWTPDVYEGAPSCVTAFFAIVPKLAAFGLLMRLLFEPFAAASDQWMQILYFLSAASMLVGAFAGLAQNNVKRLLAYSSIGNMGYALVGLVAVSEAGVAAVVLYLGLYMIMSAGVFAVVLSVQRDRRTVEGISGMAGLSKTHPLLAYGMAILLLSMAGIPPFAGFFGKFAVFEAAVASELYVLAVLGVLTSVVAAFYYLRIIKVMFFDAADESGADGFDTDVPLARKVVLVISLLFVVGFVVKPSAFLGLCAGAAAALF
ncbi:MAG: NADH-quinone oxidoreductase subunit NuoN [Alphaproteobacteria bacterium]